MQLPSVDRTLLQRSSAEAASPAAARVIPVAPVNPSVQVQAPTEPQPSVINLVNPALRATESGLIYSSTSDPAKTRTEAATIGLALGLTECLASFRACGLSDQT